MFYFKIIYSEARKAMSKGFPQPGEGQTRSQLLGGDKQRLEHRLFPGTSWKIELSGLRSLRITLGS